VSLVESTIDHHVATITINRPERANTMTPELLTEAVQVLERLAASPDVRVVILTGAGRAFCAGGDLSRGPGGAVNGDGPLHEQTKVLRGFMRASELLHSMSAVTIAAVNGACAGAGLSLACAADLRFSSSTARYNTAFLNAGLPGDFGGTWLLPRIIGWGRAYEKYLLSQPFSAEEAHRIGLVSAVFEPELLMAEVQEIATRLAAAAPLALTAMKQNLRDASGSDFVRALDDEARRHAYCATTEDAAEAARAFIEKRPPSYSGR
jgi:2-(1,2-epoxy-1,2-dihydrophenyl)acetyl-CoA isomerase